jgi:hypothetical protein
MSSRQNLFAGATCFVFFLLFYGITSRGKLQASDEAAVFASGISLATTGRLAIDNFGWLQEKVNIGSVGPDGHLYTKHFPGNVFAVALIYKLTARPNDTPYVWVQEIAPVTLGLLGFFIQIVALLRDPTHVLIDRVQSGDVKFEDTIYSVRHCWLALQIDGARNAQMCDLDSYTLRRLLTHCSD